MKYFLTYLAVFLSLHGNAQRLVDRSGTVSFFSEAPMENIEATNRQVLAVIDKSNGSVAVTMLMRGFKFNKSLMEKHFNENYVESDQYPKALFEGSIEHFTPEMFTPGEHTASVNGDLTIHGIKQPLNTEITIVVDENRITVCSKFPVSLEDHEIKIPKIVIANIAEVVDVTAFLTFENGQL